MRRTNDATCSRAPFRVGALLETACVVALLATAPPLLAQLPDDVGAGTLYFRTSPIALTQATRLETDVHIAVTGIVARVSVSQRFRNDGTDWVEGIYVLPLPEHAAVDRLTMLIGERRIEGEIQERAQAKRTYERARDAGQHASLVEQERPNLFTTSVANIAPGQEIVIEIAYLETVAYDGGGFTLRFPMTLTPRYVPGRPLGTATGEGWSFDTSEVDDASRITSPVLDPAGDVVNLATIEATIDAGLPLAGIESSHAVSAVRDGAGYRVVPVSGTVPMDRDLILKWRPLAGDTPRAAAFTETRAGERYVVLLVVPPEQTRVVHGQPREIIFVVDTSGSMGGPSIEQAKSALQTALARLTTTDRFNVIQFNSTTSALHPAPVAATPATLAAAAAYVAGLSANGGTEMRPAIARSLGGARLEGYLRQVVFVTDGSVGNEAALFASIRQNLGDARFFTIGIGAAPNSHFMRKAAQFGRGSFSHIGRLDEVAEQMAALFDKLGHVALTDIEIAWPGGAEMLPDRIPDLYLGEPVVVAARLDAGLPVALEVEVSGRAGRAPWSRRIAVTPGRADGIAALWARRRIERLMDSALEGTPAATIRDAVVDVALEHGLVSKYTSLVAVDLTPARSREAMLRREAVANMLPAGADAGAIFGQLPQTATHAPLRIAAGLLAMLLALAALGARRRIGPWTREP